MSKDVVKKTKFNTLNVQVHNLEKKVPDTTTLIHTNYYNTGKKNWKTNWRRW